MGLAFIIVGGVVLMTLFASGFDFLTKRRNRLDNETKLKVDEMEKKVANLELMISDKNEKMHQLENEVSFLNKLLEKK